MTYRRISAWMAAVLFLSLGSGAVVAQDGDSASRRAGYSSILDSMDMLIDNYSRMLARKYDLNAEQSEFTRQLIHGRIKEFVNAHDAEIRSSLDRMFEVRAGGAMEPSELMAWGATVQPLLEEAKRVITDSNNEFRAVLTEQQRAIHDQDLKLMAEGFALADAQVGRIVSGDMSVEEFRNPPRMAARRAQPTPPPADPDVVMPSPQGRVDSSGVPVIDSVRRRGVPAQPPGPETNDPAAQHQAEQGNGIVHEVQEAPHVAHDPAGMVQPEEAVAHPGGHVAPTAPVPGQPQPAGRQPGGRRGAPTAGKGFESDWERYTHDFIQRYKLNEEQTTKALSMLKDCQEQGRRHMRGKQQQMDQLDQDAAKLATSQDKDKAARVAEIAAQRAKLLDPLNQIFEKQLKPRLETLPTRAQRRAAEDAARKPVNPASTAAPKPNRNAPAKP